LTEFGGRTAAAKPSEMKNKSLIDGFVYKAFSKKSAIRKEKKDVG